MRFFSPKWLTVTRIRDYVYDKIRGPSPLATMNATRPAKSNSDARYQQRLSSSGVSFWSDLLEYPLAVKPETTV